MILLHLPAFASKMFRPALRSIVTVFSISFIFSLQAAEPAVEPGFISLYNGKDFTGWKIGGPEQSFKIEDGAIVANGAASHAYYVGPFRNHVFRNFELKVDVMTRTNSNGGVYVLTEFQPTGGNKRKSGDFPSEGFEIQVNNTYVRDPIKTGSLYHVVDINRPPAKDNEWFTEDITVKGDTITVKVNGKQTVQWTQPADWNGGKEGPGRSIKPGTIALQAHDPGSKVYYKNIRIKPLD
jgi:hypothetical protein